MEARLAEEESRFVLANKSRLNENVAIVLTFKSTCHHLSCLRLSCKRNWSSTCVLWSSSKSIGILIFASDEHSHSCQSIVLLPEECFFFFLFHSIFVSLVIVAAM